MVTSKIAFLAMVLTFLWAESSANAERVTSRPKQPKLVQSAARKVWIRVGRWMSQTEYNGMKMSGRVLEGSGGKTSVSVNGVTDHANEAKNGSVYVQFEVPADSLVQGGNVGWYSLIGPNAGQSQKMALQKQGGEMLPKFRGLRLLYEKTKTAEIRPVRTSERIASASLSKRKK